MNLNGVFDRVNMNHNLMTNNNFELSFDMSYLRYFYLVRRNVNVKFVLEGLWIGSLSEVGPMTDIFTTEFPADMGQIMGSNDIFSSEFPAHLNLKF